MGWKVPLGQSGEEPREAVATGRKVMGAEVAAGDGFNSYSPWVVLRTLTILVTCRQQITGVKLSRARFRK